MKMETIDQLVSVSSGVMGLMIDKFGLRLKEKLRADWYLAMDPVRQCLSLTYPLDIPDVQVSG